MPALLPPCMQLVETGVTYVHGELIRNLLAVSADGMIECQSGYHHRSCQSPNNYGHYTRVVEIKSIFNESLISRRYQIPWYHGCQLLCEMFAKQVGEAWYVLVGRRSVILFTLQFQTQIWVTVWNDIKSRYDTFDPKRPKFLNPERKVIIQALKDYIANNSQFICEVPKLIASTIEPLRGANILGPFRLVYSCMIDTKPEEISTDRINEIVERTTEVIEESYNLLRRLATELITFLLTDTDRQYNKKYPAHNPIAYAMKGKNLSMFQMRQMVEMVRDHCKEENVIIVCEASDGQFKNMVCRTIDNKPLTWIQWQRDNWVTQMKKSRQDLLTKFQDVGVVTKEMQDILINADFSSPNTLFIEKNLCLRQHTDRNGKVTYYMWSSGSSGPDYLEDLQQFIFTTKRWKHRNYDPVWDYKQGMRQTQYLEPELEESDVVKLLAKDREEINTNDSQGTDEITDNAFDNDGNHTAATTHDAFDRNTNIRHGILSSSTENEDQPATLLETILVKLQTQHQGHDWSSVSVASLLQSKMCSAEVIAKEFFVYELDMIAEVLHTITHKRRLFKKSANKQTKVNLISKFFGDKSIWYKEIKTKHRKEVPTLSTLASEYMLQSVYPKPLLAACASRLHHEEEFREWRMSSLAGYSTYLDPLNCAVENFWTPEFSQKRNQIEARTFDPTHILTNLRANISKKGFQHVSPQAFKDVSDRNNDILSRAVVYELVDKQNLDVALHFFSVEVEEDMQKHSDFKSAEFVKLTRNWFHACDERGLSVKQRLTYLKDMHDYLMQFYSPNQYPPPSTHVYNLPLPTFEMLLQATSCRFQLYGLTAQHKFNARSISSLGAESYYSDITAIDTSGATCPKAHRIPKIKSIIVEYNTARHDPTKLFNMDKRRGAPYPSRPLDPQADSGSSEDESSNFRSHSFDRIPRKFMKRKKFRPTMSGPNEPSRGEENIRTIGKYRLNEAKIKSCTRMGLPEDVDISV